MSVKDWQSGAKLIFKKISLQPAKMKRLSGIPVEVTAPAKKVYSFEKEVTEQDRKDSSIKQMFAIASEHKDAKLAQDLKEGVSDSEWD